MRVSTPWAYITRKSCQPTLLHTPNCTPMRVGKALIFLHSRNAYFVLTSGQTCTCACNSFNCRLRIVIRLYNLSMETQSHSQTNVNAYTICPSSLSCRLPADWKCEHVMQYVCMNIFGHLSKKYVYILYLYADIYRHLFLRPLAFASAVFLFPYLCLASFHLASLWP